ncbi:MULTISPECIES: adenylosuccinate lyase [Fructobacillus]|jgi:adenylosuccinate lyase|uniref:Adenylosuccinate lyase n=1 Tax=Fructobacillus cardui TaxID=2893170 RepID=A0ABM9MXK7_9LACO|nr:MULTISPECIES: adenylosuccinate lyase [Fructobacillus]KMK53869.1 Adenylosuccinate lyase [Fructobacillus sp. EFB-N1]MCK8627982.1 adenylosuccinate lyase [Fructobacillus cardui]CAK1222375.1 Adenylosuccinate lyase (PurB) [Fructobacillus cardui]CAK1224525.1 Adenylosuccinate lyase (PurB) [Fructobacillus cardui]CAK1247115.1 Adenylosuccinate lyase (PurB) [Fructobacillus cardui]
MLDRYSRPAMRDIWSLQNQYQTWLDVEIAIDEAWSKLGEIPAEDVEKIRQNATFDVARIEEIEAVTHHDIVAFTRTVSESLGEEKKWVHFGITSTDVVDTSYGVRLKQANAILEEDLENFIAVLKKKAIEYKDTVMIGRTHGVQAEPTTFGLKIARFYSEMERNLERFKKAARGVEAGKISGAVGTFANIPPEIEQYVCERLGLHAQEISSQVLPRDLHADYMATLALIASSMEGFAVEIRSLQRSEIHEVEEKFAKGQKGSSAMPHKRNPIGSENICGLARVVRGQMVTAYENIPLWHERDISHSSAERMILPDSTSLLDYMLNRFMKIIDTLTVFPERMKSNMNLTHGLIYSQRVLLKLIETGMARETAYDLVQPLTAKSWDEGRSFKDLVEGDKTITAHLSQAEIDDAFDYHYHLSQVDTIFKRLGLTD